ncbi:MFS transporter [Pedobacter puniceum]|jgi:ACS family hexuronate transporter-like MFS transporter|uniref:MFS transporter n=1 Tax=Pedobacter puniceum TaxID=2666136 RepID=A0A7K0FMF7_9SPHI|nr:MFS transporter [Pedobacter puniceum]MRX47012.1 MFS transporter [Pedobacter puniceum]
MTDTTFKPSKMRWVMIGFAFLATVLNYIDRLAFNYLSAEGALRELIPDDAFGYITTAFFVAYMVSNGFSGFAIDKLGTKLGYSICMAFWTTAAMLHALARLPWHFGLARFFLGIGEAGNWPSAIKLTSEWFPQSERSTASGIFNSGSAIGAVVAPPLIAFLGTVYGWKATFIIVGSLGYLWLIAFWFTYYTPKQALEETKLRTIPAKKLIKNKFVLGFTLSKVLMDPVWYFITFWIGRYLVDVHGWDLTTIGWFAMIPFISADFGNILGGLFTQTLIKRGMAVPRARKLAVTIFGLMTAGSLILGPLIITSPAIAIAVLAVAGFGYSSYTANSMAFPADVVPKNATASVWGLASVGSGLGGAIFQSISGVTVKNFSDAYGYSSAYNTVFIGYGVLALLGLCVVLFVIGPLVRDEELHAYVNQDNPEENQSN